MRKSKGLARISKCVLLIGAGFVGFSQAAVGAVTVYASVPFEALPGAEPTQVYETHPIEGSADLTSEFGSRAYAFGSLATGQFGAFASSAYKGLQALTIASVTFDDGIRVRGAVVDPVDGFLTVHFHGTIEPGSLGPGYDGTFVDGSLTVEVSGLSNASGKTILEYTFVDYPEPGAVVSEKFEYGTSTDRTFRLPLIINADDAFFRINATITAAAIGGGVANFANTATFGIELPTGLTFTSDSGVFPGQSPVPEPSSWLLFAVGLCGIGGLHRARRPAR